MWNFLVSNLHYTRNSKYFIYMLHAVDDGLNISLNHLRILYTLVLPLSFQNIKRIIWKENSDVSAYTENWIYM